MKAPAGVSLAGPLHTAFFTFEKLRFIRDCYVEKWYLLYRFLRLVAKNAGQNSSFYSMATHHLRWFWAQKNISSSHFHIWLIHHDLKNADAGSLLQLSPLLPFSYQKSWFIFTFCVGWCHLNIWLLMLLPITGSGLHRSTPASIFAVLASPLFWFIHQQNINGVCSCQYVLFKFEPVFRHKGLTTLCLAISRSVGWARCILNSLC